MISMGPKVPMKNSVFHEKSYVPLVGEVINTIGFNPRNNIPCPACRAMLGLNAVGLVSLVVKIKDKDLQGKEIFRKQEKTFIISVCRECEETFGNELHRS